ncbi:MAG: phenylalanine 4-monooxygenase [Proteobacteria bacterium]|nr:phenylalanine 4-monooxygenase [Pseudomonadota bacterium]
MALRADEHPEGMRPDYTFDFDPREYSEGDHARWHFLCERQKPLLKGRACNEYLKALQDLSIVSEAGIPDLRRVSDQLEKTTGWQIVTVPGLIPGGAFLEHLSKRQFPVTWWIRSQEKIDYLQEPDIFHDLFGHVPLLSNPVFADYMQQFGLGAMKAKEQKAIRLITRLYWFTVEFGLINTPEGLRIYGSGIVSSAKESVFALESQAPNRLKFDLIRMMRTNYRYDNLQRTYFVIDSFEQLFEETRPDFTEYYAHVKSQPDIGEFELLPSDRVVTRGTGEFPA